MSNRHRSAGAPPRPSLLVPVRPGSEKFVSLSEVRETMEAYNLGGGPHNGASTGRRMAGFRPSGSGPNSVVQVSAPELVRRSRDMRRNVPHARRALDLVSIHAVGIGIKPRFLCSNKKVREALTELWADWTQVADADGALDFYGLQALAVSELAEGGESFARLRSRRLSDGLPVPLQIQLLPTEQVPLDYNLPYGTNSVVQGIERDILGRRAAYWCYSQHPSDYLAMPSYADMTPRRVLAADMVHLYNVTRIGQLRGIPWLAAAITTLHQVHQYVDAELLRKQMVSSIVGFVRKAVTAEMDAEELAKAWGEVLDTVGGELPAVSMEPGTMQYLDVGEDVEFNNPQDTAGNFDPFLTRNYQAVSASIGALYEEVTGDWKNSNDRTFRAQFNTWKRQVQQWQYNLVCHQFNHPIAMRFISYAVASGALRVPKSVADKDLRRIDWRPHRWDYLNPKQDIEAQEKEIDAGLTSRQATVAERGDDIEIIDQQRADDQARERQLGIEKKAKAAPAPLKENDDEQS